jgi:ABC-type tungstate transport system permease subunit
MVFILISAPASAEQYKQIIIATGSPFELGLIDALAKVFEKESGCIVR